MFWVHILMWICFFLFESKKYASLHINGFPYISWPPLFYAMMFCRNDCVTMWKHVACGQSVSHLITNLHCWILLYSQVNRFLSTSINSLLLGYLTTTCFSKYVYDVHLNAINTDTLFTDCSFRIGTVPGISQM